MQKASCCSVKTERQQFVNNKFQIFSLSKRVFFTFPLRYFFAIGHQKFLELRVEPQYSNRYQLPYFITIYQNCYRVYTFSDFAF